MILAGFLACSGLKGLPIRQKPDSGKSRFKLFDRAYSYGYSSGFAPDSLKLHMKNSCTATKNRRQIYSNYMNIHIILTIDFLNQSSCFFRLFNQFQDTIFTQAPVITGSDIILHRFGYLNRKAPATGITGTHDRLTTPGTVPLLIFLSHNKKSPVILLSILFSSFQCLAYGPDRHSLPSQAARCRAE